MDDVFQIIIWLFIIISFFASFFKKKEPPKQQTPPRRYGNQEESFPVKKQPAGTIENEEYDILREIESMFKTGPTPPAKPEQKEGPFIYNRSTESEHVRSSGEITSYETGRAANEYTKGQTAIEKYHMDTARSKGEEQLTSSEHSFGSPVNSGRKQREIRKEKDRVDAAVIKQALDFEIFLKGREQGVSMAAKIREKINQPASFKEYILMSEILGKPAFKTGGRAFRKAN
jgi:hypothetical protein